MRSNLVAEQNGEIEVTIVNNDTSIPVYFDNLKIQVLGDEKPLVLQENHYYPFGMNMKGIENEPEGYHKFQYNGKEKQTELGLNWADYGWRNYQADLGRWFGVDPLAEKYYDFSPYNYVLNNPLKYIDPDGRFTELFNKKGEKIGQDKDGNKGGKVSIIKDNKEVRRIRKSYKKGGVATENDVNMGVRTTKGVLKEALAVLQRTEANGGVQEENSVVTANSEVIEGEPGEVLDVSAGEVHASTEIVIPEGEGNTSIHSHILDYFINQDNGKVFSMSAEEPGPGDPSAFQNFDMNIIVGWLGRVEASGKKEIVNDGTNTDNPVKYSVNNKPKQGAAFFGKKINQKSPPILTLTKKAMERIISNQ